MLLALLVREVNVILIDGELQRTIDLEWRRLMPRLADFLRLVEEVTRGDYIGIVDQIIGNADIRDFAPLLDVPGSTAASYTRRSVPVCHGRSFLADAAGTQRRERSKGP